MSLLTFIHASAHDMPQVADGSVQMIATSPPYYGLRKYAGAQDVDWPAVDYAPMPGLSPMTVEPMRCPLGNEPTLEAYIAHMVLCLREWRRVLRDDGIAFVNLGDSFSGSGGAGGDYNAGGLREGQPKFKAGKSTGLKPKDLMMVPARFALAAQADGWWLRSDMIGAKVAPMPESVTDRPTRSHEHIFMLTKRASYFCDMEGVKEPLAASTEERYNYGWNGRNDDGSGGARTGSAFEKMKNGATMREAMGGANGRNMRDVIEWRPQGFSAAHFATWPEAIPERLIRMGTSERGACPYCGAAWRRVVERERVLLREKSSTNGVAKMRDGGNGYGRNDSGGKWDITQGPATQVITTGFAPTCTCPTHEPTPCVVLDPFSGSGTTAKVAARLGRQGVGVDISQEYLTDITAARMGDGFQMEMIR
jgi:DNA modification methylase